jgi:hypothetical protein
MRLPRMTTRRWMIAVSVVGLVMGGIVGGVRLKRRHDYYLSRAQHHNTMVEIYIRKGVETLDPRYQRLLFYHGTVARKYWHAASYPWLPVEPDPPMPE